MVTKNYKTIGTVGRFKPVHLAHSAMLEALCAQSEHVIIGLGSSNVYDLRSPFTAKESKDMIDLALKGKDNYTIIEIPDLFNGPKWREQALKLYGKLDLFATANDYVTSLLKNDYQIVHPVTLIPTDKQIPLNATMVRLAMAQGRDWTHMVPAQIADYIKTNKLDERFVREFGLATLVANLEAA